MEEEWKTIPGFSDYVVSNLGRVYSTQRNKMLKTAPDNKGYPVAHLNRDGRLGKVAVHRLVAFAFVDGYFVGAFVNHKDGIKTNNVFWNLEWLTNAENTHHAYSTGLHSTRSVRIIETEEVFDSAAECARYLGIAASQISNCLNKKRYSLDGKGYAAKGLHFEYAD